MPSANDVADVRDVTDNVADDCDVLARQTKESPLYSQHQPALPAISRISCRVGVLKSLVFIYTHVTSTLK